MTRRISLGLCIALILQTSACVTVTTPRFLRPAPERDWPGALDRARELAAAGNVARADSVLAAYAASYPASPYAVETYYWRPVLQLQADAPGMPATTSATLLSAYLGHAGAEHLAEARTLRRTLLRVDSLARMSNALALRIQNSDGEVTSANAKAADARADARDAKSDTRDQEAEIRRLRDELAKSKEELDRVKKRLSEPTPKKPPR